MTDKRYIGSERRRDQERRITPRGGKMERRKNKCSSCQFYAPQDTVAGICQKHQSLILAHDFACPWFVLKPKQ
jgi:hypothetical protein